MINYHNAPCSKRFFIPEFVLNVSLPYCVIYVLYVCVSYTQWPVQTLYVLLLHPERNALETVLFFSLMDFSRADPL